MQRLKTFIIFAWATKGLAHNVFIKKLERPSAASTETTKKAGKQMNCLQFHTSQSYGKRGFYLIPRFKGVEAKIVNYKHNGKQDLSTKWPECQTKTGYFYS